MPRAESHGQSYTLWQRRLHWLVALLVALQYLLQNPMSDAMRKSEAGADIGVGGFLVTTVHSVLGLCIGLLLVWRWRLARDRQIRPGAGQLSGVTYQLALWNHRALYMLLLLMVVSGATHYYLTLPVAATVHWACKWALVAAVVLHVCGAAWHHWVRQDPVLQRMLGLRRHTATIGAGKKRREFDP